MRRRERMRSEKRNSSLCYTSFSVVLETWRRAGAGECAAALPKFKFSQL
jgi:hypothetical protein